MSVGRAIVDRGRAEAAAALEYPTAKEKLKELAVLLPEEEAEAVWQAVESWPMADQIQAGLQSQRNIYSAYPPAARCA